MNRFIETPGIQLESELKTAPRPVLVRFCIRSSGSRQMPARSLETLAGELAGELDCRKINLDDHPELARRYHLSELPAWILFDHGVPVAGFADSISARCLLARVQGLLADYAPKQERDFQPG